MVIQIFPHAGLHGVIELHRFLCGFNFMMSDHLKDRISSIEEK